MLVLQRQVTRPRFTETDRTILAAISAALDRRRLAEVFLIVRPATIIRRHRRLVARHWTQPSISRQGREREVTSSRHLQAWESVQAASQLQRVLGLSRVRDSVNAAQLERVTPMLIGYLTTVGALLNRPALRLVLDAVPLVVAQYEQRRGVTFEELVAAKRKKWGLG